MTAICQLVLYGLPHSRVLSRVERGATMFRQRPSPERKVQAHWRQTFQSLQNRRYRTYSIGQVISMAGTWMQSVAISWVVYKLTGSAWDLGLVQFANYLPVLLLTFPGGMIADRFNPRRVIVITQWLEMLQALILTALVLSGHLSVGWLTLMAVFLGCCTAVEAPCRQALVPQLVSKSEWTNAIGLNSAIYNVSRLIGPMLAAAAIALGGDVVCFVANALSYVAAIVTLGWIRSDDEPRSWRSTAAGVTTAAGAERTIDLRSWIMQPHIRNVIAMVGCLSIFGFQFSVLLPVIAVEVLKDSTGAYVGILSAAMGVGALFGSLMVANEHGEIPRLVRRTGYAALTLSLGILLMAAAKGLVSWLVAGAAGPAFSTTLLVIMLAAIAVCGFAISMQLGASNSQLQLQVPGHLRGRVMSIYSTFMMGLLPFSSLAAGWIAQQYGLLFALALSGAAIGVASIVYLFQSHKH
jgi:MFS family permease